MSTTGIITSYCLDNLLRQLAPLVTIDTPTIRDLLLCFVISNSSARGLSALGRRLRPPSGRCSCFPSQNRGTFLCKKPIAFILLQPTFGIFLEQRSSSNNALPRTSSTLFPLLRWSMVVVLPSLSPQGALTT